MTDYDTGYERGPGPDPNEYLSTCPGGHYATPVEFITAVDRGGQPYQQVRGCRQCDAGLEFDVCVIWMPIMYRTDQQGFLRFNERGTRLFEKFERQDPDRAALIKPKVVEAVDRRNKERSRKVEAPPGWRQ